MKGRGQPSLPPSPAGSTGTELYLKVDVRVRVGLEELIELVAVRPTGDGRRPAGIGLGQRRGAARVDGLIAPVGDVEGDHPIAQAAGVAKGPSSLATLGDGAFAPVQDLG